jgi:hypothetical protein
LLILLRWEPSIIEPEFHYIPQYLDLGPAKPSGNLDPQRTRRCCSSSPRKLLNGTLFLRPSSYTAFFRVTGKSSLEYVAWLKWSGWQMLYFPISQQQRPVSSPNSPTCSAPAANIRRAMKLIQKSPQFILRASFFIHSRTAIIARGIAITRPRIEQISTSFRQARACFNTRNHYLARCSDSLK